MRDIDFSSYETPSNLQMYLNEQQTAAVQVCGDIIRSTGIIPGTAHHRDAASLRLDATQLYEDLRWTPPENDDAFFRIMMRSFRLRVRLNTIIDETRRPPEDRCRLEISTSQATDEILQMVEDKLSLKCMVDLLELYGRSDYRQIFVDLFPSGAVTLYIDEHLDYEKYSFVLHRWKYAKRTSFFKKIGFMGHGGHRDQYILNCTFQNRNEALALLREFLEAPERDTTQHPSSRFPFLR